MSNVPNPVDTSTVRNTDVTDLERSIVGDDLVLSAEAGGGFTLHRVSEDGRPYRIGTFDNVLDLWKVVDGIDTGFAPAQAA